MVRPDSLWSPGMRRPSLLKPAFSLDPAKRILLYSGVVQHYMICSYYVTVFRVLEVFRNTASKLDPRLTVNRPFLPGIPGSIQALSGPGKHCLVI